MIHIRIHPDAPPETPRACGSVKGESVSTAWGLYGPGGDGFADICQDCYTAQLAGKLLNPAVPFDLAKRRLRR